MAYNSISFIQRPDFKTLPLTDKVMIKNLGRPTPNLNLHQEDKVGTRTFMRHFSVDIYKRFKWTSGCDVTNSLFCFPCVFFRSDETDKIWSVTGFKDLKHVIQKAKRHEISVPHIHCCLELSLLGSINSIGRLDRMYRQKIIKYNEQVTKNRYVLKKLINCIKYCGKLDLVLRGHVEEKDGILCELVDFSPELDAILKEHLQTTNARVFKGTSKTIQNEILESMLAVCRQEIKQQIIESDFLAIQYEETSDISNEWQMVLILRYYHNGNLYERFWRFLKITDKSSDGLMRCLESEIDELISDSPSKLIAQTRDGVIVTNATTSELQSKIREKYKHAHFVHCYAHQLNLIIQKATSQNTKVKLFFSNLSAIPAFFSSRTHRCDVLEEIFTRKLPKITIMRFHYDIHTVNIVYENRDQFIECFEELEEKCSKTITCKEAYSLRKTLEDPNFIFWLNFFHQIFPRAEKLFNLLLTRYRGNVALKRELEEFETFLLSLSNNSTVVVKEEVNEEEDADTNKRRRIMPEKNYITVNKVCDSINSLVKERLSNRGYLEAASLVHLDNFLYYSQNFPELTFKSVVRNYYPIFEHEKLKTELEVLYSSKHFKNIRGGINMLAWLNEHGLNETFCELVKLLKINVTTPMFTMESERCYSTLKKIKAFLRNTGGRERLNALAMMSVNKNLIYDIDNFDEKVVEHYISQGNAGPDFVYKP